MPDQINFGAGPTITTVSSAPGIDYPVGSLALRHTGSASSTGTTAGFTLYCKAKPGLAAGAWVAVQLANTKAGTPADSDFTTAPPDGTIVADTSGSKLWVRLNGSWLGVAVA